MDSNYLFLTCVKNNAIGLIEKEFLDDQDWYLSNCLKIHPCAIYICLERGYTRLLKLLLAYLPHFKFKPYLASLAYAIDVAIQRGYDEPVEVFLHAIS